MVHEKIYIGTSETIEARLIDLLLILALALTIHLLVTMVLIVLLLVALLLSGTKALVPLPFASK